MAKSKRNTVAVLTRKVMELEAQLASTYHFADATIQSGGRDRMMGSGVLVRLTTIGGSDICIPFVLKDGLSAETIAALRADIRYSYDLATSFKPRSA